MPNENICDDADQDWILLIKQGNQQAFGKLYDKYAPMLMGLIVKLVGDKRTAENVLERVFYTVWESKACFDFSKERLFPKMLKITRELCSGEKPNPAIEICEADKTVHIVGISGPLQTEDSIKVPGLLYNMEKMGSEALHLIYFEGYTFADAATALNLSLNDLKEKVKTAIRDLKVAVVS